jgi:hypothetical protein
MCFYVRLILLLTKHSKWLYLFASVPERNASILYKIFVFYVKLSFASEVLQYCLVIFLMEELFISIEHDVSSV